MLVLEYVREAIKNQKQVKAIKPAVKKLDIIAELAAALAADSGWKKAFEKLSPGKQQEYAGFIGSAKQEATRLSCLGKCKPIFISGAGLNDKYK